MGEKMLKSDGHEVIPMVKMETEEEAQEGEEEEVTKTIDSPDEMLYTIDENPPLYTSIMLGLQHFSLMFLSQVAAATIVGDIVGMGDDVLSRGQLISTLLIVSAFCTLLQTTLGNRLPIVQGATASYLMPLLAISSLPKWNCQGVSVGVNDTIANTVVLTYNITEDNPTYNNSDGRGCDTAALWKMRLNEGQGALIGAAVVNMFIGYSGAIGLIVSYVRPLTVAVIITLLGLPLARIAVDICAKGWPISITSIIIASVLGQYLNRVRVPLPSFSFEKKRCEVKRAAIFMTYPVLLALVLAWILCAFLTIGGALDGPEAWKASMRTNTTAQALKADKTWIRFPLPFQFGMPTFTASGILGMLCGTFVSTLESIGDYYTCARLAGAPRPPRHAMNRGIGTEGLGNLLCGMWGCGLGTTSYNGNIGVIALTRVGSRRVIQYAAVWMFLFGLISKIGTICATIPYPIIGGVFLYILGFVISAGLSELQAVNMNRPRNLYILGLCLTVGLSVPHWIEANPQAISTGYEDVDQVLSILMRSGMFIGGVVCLFLDNTIHDPDRSNKVTRPSEGHSNEHLPTYEFPFGMKLIRKLGFLKYIPCSPTFTGFRFRPLRN